MPQYTSIKAPPPEPSGAPPDLRAHILATEHWSLLATRGMTWTEIFSRTGTFLTVLSAAVVALSLVAQAASFGDDFQTFALLVLPVVLFIGVATFLRLVEADCEDVRLVAGMNRLRHAYLELAPELEPYFVTSHHDDEPGVLQTYGWDAQPTLGHLLSGSPVIVGIIDAALTGVLVAVTCQALGAPTWLQIVLGIVVALVTAVLLGMKMFRRVSRLRRMLAPRFPSATAIQLEVAD